MNLVFSIILSSLIFVGEIILIYKLDFNDFLILWGYRVHGHRFTTDKDFFFIGNELGGCTKYKHKQRIINGKSKRKKDRPKERRKTKKP